MGISSTPDTRQWQYKSGADWVTLEGETGLSLTITHDAALWAGRLTLTLRYLVDGAYSDMITLAKLYCGEDAVHVEVFSSSGSSFINGDIGTTLEARVYRGALDITSSIAPQHFSWTRTSDNPEGDAVWSQLHEGIGSSVTIGDADVVRKAVFECNVTINPLL